VERDERVGGHVHHHHLELLAERHLRDGAGRELEPGKLSELNRARLHVAIMVPSMADREEIRVPTQSEPISHYTDAVRTGDLLFVSGFVPVDAGGALVGGDDVVAQTRQVFKNIGEVLDVAGATFADIVKVTVYLTDIDDRPLINPVRQEIFGDVRPASTLIEISRLAIPGAKIEIDCVARIRG
jgi:reactive intermediate/imine deaminase